MARDMACITTVSGKRGDSYRAQVWDPRAGKLHRKTFRVLAEARRWRDDVRIAVKHGTMRSASRTTVAEAAHALIAGMEAGSILDRSGRPYKPATRRSYQQALRDYVLPDIGPRTLSDVRRADVQDMVDRWRARGLSPSTIANKLDPLNAGRRRIPLVGNLRKLLAAHQLATGRRDDDLCFGRTETAPFIPSTVRSRARKAWKAAGLEPLTPHEARHCAASYLIAAGLNPKQLSVYIGHSDIRTTYNRHGHLMPGGEVEAVAQLDRFLGAQEARA